MIFAQDPAPMLPKSAAPAPDTLSVCTKIQVGHASSPTATSPSVSVIKERH